MAKRTKKTSDTKEAVLSIRIRPKVKYALELLARKQHRAVSAVVETMAIEAITLGLTGSPRNYFGEESGEIYFDVLWATTEVERLSRLVTYAHDLMTYDDTRLWEVVLSLKANPSVWGGFKVEEGDGGVGYIDHAIRERVKELPDGWVLHGRYSWDKSFVTTLNAGLLHALWNDISALSEGEIAMRDLERKIRDFKA